MQFVSLKTLSRIYYSLPNPKLEVEKSIDFFDNYYCAIFHSTSVLSSEDHQLNFASAIITSTIIFILSTLKLDSIKDSLAF